MASAPAATAPRRARTPPRARRPPRRIRWDRVGRIAMLCVLGALLYLYVSGGVRWLSTWRNAHRQDAAVARLKRDNARLAAQKASLLRPSTVMSEARALGMQRAGERTYIVNGLPRN